jgi:prevent-host-death family protein
MREIMQKVNVRETRQHIGRILDSVATGEEFIITRRDKPVAKLSGIHQGDITSLCFPDRSDLRAKLPECRVACSKKISEMRDERG